MEHCDVTPASARTVDGIIWLHAFRANSEQVAGPRVEPREGRSGTGAQWHPHTESIARHSLGRDIERSYGSVVNRASLTEQTHGFRDGCTRGLWPFQRSDLHVPTHLIFVVTNHAGRGCSAYHELSWV